MIKKSWYRRLAVVGLFLFPVFGPGWAMAQTYPSKPIRWIVPFQPGGTTDIIARLVGQKLSEAWGQQVVIDNRPGASAMIGTDLGAKAAPDGYTLMFAYNGNMTMNPNLFRKLPYDPIKDFTPVSLIVATPMILVVHPSVSAKTLQEFIALAKAQSGKFNLAVGGGVGQLSGELFKSMAKVDLFNVPYKGNAPSLAAVLAGEASVMFETTNAALPHVKAGKLRALAVTSAKRSSVLPDVPSIGEVVPGYDVSVWFGVSVPAGTPKDIVNKISTEIARIVKAPDTRERFAAQGLEVVGSTPEHLAAIIKPELDTWARVVKEANIPVE